MALSINPPQRAEGFLQCPSCKKVLFLTEFEQNLRVCNHCGHHDRLTARQRIEATFDPGSFEELDADLRSIDRLGFPDYQAKLSAAEAKTGMFDSVVTGLAQIDSLPVSVAVADFSFMGGSMGAVAGEKITRCLERAAERKIAAVIFCASGGARMQEGLFSLMQMAKTTAAAQLCNEAGVPYIAIFTDPTMAGVLASYASVADVILAEPKALVGFAGARVSKQAGVSKVPDDFQTAEFVHHHGMLDKIVPRKQLRHTLGQLISALCPSEPREPEEPALDLPPVETAAKYSFKRDAVSEEPGAPKTEAKTWREWERPLIELEEGVAKLKEMTRREPDEAKRADIERKVAEFEARIEKYLDVTYAKLDAWQEVLVARADKRPYTLDYVNAIFSNFVELDGDRRFGADHAIVGGTASLDGRPVMIVGHQKGRNIQERQFRNFAMAKPEGYRKAIRLMEMAERFRLPLISLVDTPAADPGVESESRGISEAIAAGMFQMFKMTVPTIAVVIGEGGSGGAIGIAAASRVLMQEHAIYSVIPPEGCAAILWRSPEKGSEAAMALKLTASKALEYELIDGIVAEPKGGAHRDPIEAAAHVKSAILSSLAELSRLAPHEIKSQRYAKFRKMGS